MAAASDDDDASTAAQMACNRAVQDVLAKRLKSAEVLEDQKLAAGALVVGEYLLMMQAVSTGKSPPPADVSSLERDIQRSPDDLLLARLYATRCREPECARQKAFARLVDLEPDNLATWMLDLHDEHRPTPAEDDAWLAQAARATYFDPHKSELALAVLEVAGPMPAIPACEGPLRAMQTNSARQPQPEDAVTPVALVMASLQLPIHVRLWQACPRRKVVAWRQADCQKVHALLAGSTEAMYAAGSLRWLADHAQTQSERVRWSARWRDLQWAMDAGAAKALTFENLPLVLEQGEIPVLVGYLEEHGQWPPPLDWQPPRIN